MNVQDPNALSDEEWAAMYADLKYIRQQEMERQREIVTQQIKGLMGC